MVKDMCGRQTEMTDKEVRNLSYAVDSSSSISIWGRIVHPSSTSTLPTSFLLDNPHAAGHFHHSDITALLYLGILSIDMGPPKMVMYHHNVIHPGMPVEQAAALIAANREAVRIPNAASAAMQKGEYDESISLHRRALALKLRAYSETSIQAAISFNGLGQALLRKGDLEEADEALHKALVVREAGGPNIDAADTREAIGVLREAQGRFEDAKKVRLCGAAKGHMVCGNIKASHHN
ncbi:hypothetical protein F4778DRAFT_387084 [Xylariomycetidae sp. FL2044]|nr:hypothetical protein F4778DRAFT_387084 [Xylariomycetidae sp. FL2044]